MSTEHAECPYAVLDRQAHAELLEARAKLKRFVDHIDDVPEVRWVEEALEGVEETLAAMRGGFPPQPNADAAAALRDLLAEFSEIVGAYERLKKAHEPPYAAYASWAAPQARAALAAISEESS